jgi:hypothetical protein
MKNINHIDRLLGQTRSPCVVEGPHREQLKQRLLEELQTARPRSEPRELSVFGRSPSLMKLAGGLLIVAVLIGSGWAAETIYRRLMWEGTVLSHRGPTGVTTDFETNAANPGQRKTQAQEEIRRIVAQRKYKFVRRIDRPGGDTYYLYFFPLSDGTRMKAKYPPPRLEDVASWDEYQRKAEQYAAERRRDIEQAVAGGKGRLINVIVTEIHVCRDVESNQSLEVRRAAPDCPEEGTDDFAYVYPGGIQEHERSGDSVFGTTSWPEHLKAIRDGKRELLDIRLVKQGIYEAVRADGSKFVFPRELPPAKGPS